MLELLKGHIPAGAYNISSGCTHNPKEVIDTIAKSMFDLNLITSLDDYIEIIEKPFEFTEIVTQKLDGGKLKEFIPNMKFHSLEEGISKIIKRKFI